LSRQTDGLLSIANVFPDMIFYCPKRLCFL